MDYKAARRLMTEESFPRHVPSHLVLITEALERKLEVRRSGEKRVHITDGVSTMEWFDGFNTLNSPESRTITTNKDQTGEIFAFHNISAPRNALFLRRQRRAAWRWAKGFDRVVIKPRDSLQGRDVHLNIENRRDFYAAFRAVARKYGAALVEQQVEGVERRCFVVDGKLVATAERRPASIVGDSVHSIEELVEQKNADREFGQKPLRFGDMERTRLMMSGVDPADVPATGERIFLQDSIAMALGGDSIDRTEEVSEKQREFVEAAAKAIPGLVVTGLDVMFVDDHPSDEPGYILEANSYPSLDIHLFPTEGKPRNVTRPLLDTLFPPSNGAEATPSEEQTTP